MQPASTHVSTNISHSLHADLEGSHECSKSVLLCCMPFHFRILSDTFHSMVKAANHVITQLYQKIRMQLEDN